jgi:hypothetical protein
MHKVPLTPIEEDGLIAHRLPIGTPSQLSDVFRHGIAFAKQYYDPNDPYCAALDAIDGAHWLGGTLADRIRKLIEERELAIEGQHPVQLARKARDA